MTDNLWKIPRITSDFNYKSTQSVDELGCVVKVYNPLDLRNIGESWEQWFIKVMQKDK